VLQLDQPFGALDPVTRRENQDEFGALAPRLGKASGLVTHDVREAMGLATRNAVMRDGGIAFVGTPAAFAASDDPECRALRGAA
jgi:ABC-type proline/glycine betaine transport system ATPase subunit